jgi:hypothetical protein
VGLVEIEKAAIRSLKNRFTRKMQIDFGWLVILDLKQIPKKIVRFLNAFKYLNMC